MADRLMPASGIEVAAAGVAQRVPRRADGLGDRRARPGAGARDEASLRVAVTDTMMTTTTGPSARPRDTSWRAVTHGVQCPSRACLRSSPGDDLGVLLAPGLAGDGASGRVVAVTSKMVSKAEGRLMPVDDGRTSGPEETVRVVARAATS